MMCLSLHELLRCIWVDIDNNQLMVIYKQIHLCLSGLAVNDWVLPVNINYKTINYRLILIV